MIIIWFTFSCIKILTFTAFHNSAAVLTIPDFFFLKKLIKTFCEFINNQAIFSQIQAIKSPPALPEPNEILQDDLSSDDEGGADLLEQCIRIGISKKTTDSMADSSGIKLEVGAKSHSHQIIKENPIRMLRKGGNSFIETNDDEPNRFHIEDSPCNFSIASGLSDLTIGSHKAGLLNGNRYAMFSRKKNEQSSLFYVLC